MGKSKFITYSAILLASLLVMGCNTADREVDKIGKIVNPEQNTSLPNNGGSFINDVVDDNSSTGDGVINSDDNTTTGTIQIDAKNAYKISVKFSDKYNETGYYSRDEIGELSFNITNIYTNTPANTEIIDKITLEVEEKNSDTDGKYLNFITFSGEQGPVYSIPKESVKATDSVAIKMNELSGTTNIILTASIKLNNTEATSDYKLKIPIVIEKNKSSSMAIVPIGSRYENGLFIDKFVIHVVDSYGNKAKDGTKISTGVINNPKLYSNAYNGAQRFEDLSIPTINYPLNTDFFFDDQTLPFTWRGNVAKLDYALGSGYPTILLNNFKNDKGSLNKNNGTFTLPANSIDPTADTITPLDTLVILANKEQHKPENLGGWDIKSIDSANEISLVSLDSGLDINNVRYVIGNDYRYDSCRQSLMNAGASTFESTDVIDGIAYAELRYVPSMVGKDVFIYANTRLNDKQIGISSRETLTGIGMSTDSLSCTNEKGLKPNCAASFRMILNGSSSLARNVYMPEPTLGGEPVYRATSATRTNCNGWTTVSIYGIDENKTATVNFGDFISSELILNQK